MAVNDRIDFEAAKVLGNEIIELCENSATKFKEVGTHEILTALIGALSSLANSPALRDYDVVGHLRSAITVARGGVPLVIVPPGDGGMVN